MVTIIVGAAIIAAVVSAFRVGVAAGRGQRFLLWESIQAQQADLIRVGKELSENNKSLLDAYADMQNEKTIIDIEMGLRG